MVGQGREGGDADRDHGVEWVAGFLGIRWVRELTATRSGFCLLVLGAGFSGITTAAKLKDAGISDFRIIDKAGDFGGNWYWNRFVGVFSTSSLLSCGVA